MKTIIYILILNLASSLIYSANAQEHRAIFEGKAQVGPLNPILRPVTMKDTDTKPRQTNPYFLDFQIATPTGNINDSLYNAQVQFEKLGEIIISNKERPLTLRYGLPQGLVFKKEQSIKEATVILNATNNPSSAQKRFEIKEKNHLDTAFFWEINATAFSYKTDDGLLIEQELIDDDTNKQTKGYNSIPLAIYADGQKHSLDLGKPLQFRHKGINYIAYALESSYLNSEDNGGCANGGYIIRVVISKSIMRN